MRDKISKLVIVAALAVAATFLLHRLKSTTARGRNPDTGTKDSSVAQAADQGLFPLDINLPKPVHHGTKENMRVARLRQYDDSPRLPFLVPIGTTNVASGKPVSSSDEQPTVGELRMITDGDKEAIDGSFVELGPFIQHITIDLEAMHEIYAIVVWHYHSQPRVYFDVIVQVADDADFTQNVRTLFNNDMDNSGGLGIGKDLHYVDSYMGELIDARGARARYVRLYSNGNNANDTNHYIEVEVFGRPVK
jgi:hypothetical protein